MSAKPYHFETLALHAGQTVDAYAIAGSPCVQNQFLRV